MKCSIVMATRNHGELLRRTLQSIYRQEVPFDYEVIVIDDGSDDCTEEVCKEFDLTYCEKLDNTEYRNPALARNVGFRKAKGDVIIQQSDEVIHHTPNTIELLVERLTPGKFVIATVYDYTPETDKRGWLMTGTASRRPYFFLGSLTREDLYAVGGYDEEFVAPGWDDDWHGYGLMHGLKLEPDFIDEIIGYHQFHPRMPKPEWREASKPSADLFVLKRGKARLFNNEDPALCISSGGPWPLE